MSTATVVDRAQHDGRALGGIQMLGTAMLLVGVSAFTADGGVPCKDRGEDPNRRGAHDGVLRAQIMEEIEIAVEQMMVFSVPQIMQEIQISVKVFLVQALPICVSSFLSNSSGWRAMSHVERAQAAARGRRDRMVRSFVLEERANTYYSCDGDPKAQRSWQNISICHGR